MTENRPESPELRQRIRAAIQLMRISIRWKPGKDSSHLRTRINYGHLPAAATLADYQQIITRIINDPTATVYAYVWPSAVYATVVGNYQGERWLVMFSLNGIMETAFPPDDPDEYLADVRFQLLGTVQELMR